MNFSELQSEFFARGFDYLSEDAAGIARAQRWLNQAYREICNLQAWPFLQSTTTGTVGAAYLNIPDLRKILLVGDISAGSTPGNLLPRLSLEELVGQFDVRDLSATGTPWAYYIVQGTQVTPYPVGGRLYARYLMRVAPLSGVQEPIFDEEYHNLIVDRAVIKAYIDSDNYEASAALRLEFDAGMQAMTEDYQLESRDTEYIDSGEPYDG